MGINRAEPSSLFLAHNTWPSGSAEATASYVLTPDSIPPLHHLVVSDWEPQGKGNLENHWLNDPCPNVTHFISVCLPLDKGSHMAMPKFNRAENAVLSCAWKEMNENIVNLIDYLKWCASLPAYPSLLFTAWFCSIAFVTFLHALYVIYWGIMFMYPSQPHLTCTIIYMRAEIFIFFVHCKLPSV